MQVISAILPHQGIIPGARGHSKITIPKGTQVWLIVHGSLTFWACYLSETSARKCLEGLENTVSGRARRTIDLPTLLAWNFTYSFPTRVAREKVQP